MVPTTGKLTLPVTEIQVFGEDVKMAHSYSKKFPLLVVNWAALQLAIPARIKGLSQSRDYISCPPTPTAVLHCKCLYQRVNSGFLMLLYFIASYGTLRLLERKDMKNQQDSKGADNWTGMK